MSAIARNWIENEFMKRQDKVVTAAHIVVPKIHTLHKSYAARSSLERTTRSHVRTKQINK